MREDPGRVRARRAVHAELAARGWTLTDLAHQASIGADTASDFLHGNRWPTIRTQGHIEEALGWPPGTITAICDGAEAPPPPGAERDPNLVLVRRPEGVTQRAWDYIRRVISDLAEFLLGRAERHK